MCNFFVCFSILKHKRHPRNDIRKIINVKCQLSIWFSKFHISQWWKNSPLKFYFIQWFMRRITRIIDHFSLNELVKLYIKGLYAVLLKYTKYANMSPRVCTVIWIFSCETGVYHIADILYQYASTVTTKICSTFLCLMEISSKQACWYSIAFVDWFCNFFIWVLSHTALDESHTFCYTNGNIITWKSINRICQNVWSMKWNVLHSNLQAMQIWTRRYARYIV